MTVDGLSSKHIVVVGGGITGLSAAMQALAQGYRVTVLEAEGRIGGKLDAGVVAGVTVDTGAESLLNTRPEATDLAREVGLGDEIVHPAISKASLWSGGKLHPLPAGLVMGAPSSLMPVIRSGILSPLGVARMTVGSKNSQSSLKGTKSIGDYIANAVGREVVDRFVDPLLSGVYAGDPYQLSLNAVAPALAQAAMSEQTLVRAAKAARRVPNVPVFAGIVGGVHRLATETAEHIRAQGGTVTTSARVTSLQRLDGDLWRVKVLDAPSIDADGVILTTPAYVTHPLLAEAGVLTGPSNTFPPYASVAIITLAYRAEDLPNLPEGSGFLVPSIEGRFVKASTFSSAKWAWTGAAGAERGLVILRASVGRFGDTVTPTLSDEAVVKRVVDELSPVLGATRSPVDTHVRRWNDALPQYLVGHTEFSDHMTRGVAAIPGLAIAGAAYDGIGIAACIAAGRRAAGEVLSGYLATVAMPTGEQWGTLEA